MLVASLILAFTYVGISFTKLPRVNLDRTTAAFTGAVLMVLVGVLSTTEAVQSIDFNTLALLLGMMLLIADLKEAGFFTFLARWAFALARTPGRLLVMVAVATGALSAFLVNDVVVLLFTPVVIRVCRMMRLNPVPYLITEAMASNIGSTATIVGNPQNMLIGIASGISFGRFFLLLLPVSVLSTVVLVLAIHFFYRRHFGLTGASPGDANPALAEEQPHESMKWSVPVLVLAIVLFFLSSFLRTPIPLIALFCGMVVLVLGKAKPATIMRHVDWFLLLFFAGLFVVIGGAHKAGILDLMLRNISVAPDIGGIVSVHAFSALVSQVVSNVPLTMLVIPLIRPVPGDVLWISLAAGSTLGGNATLVGAVANLIVAEQASREGVEMKFTEFLKVGLLVTPITLALSVGVLSLEYLVGWLR